MSPRGRPRRRKRALPDVPPARAVEAALFAAGRPLTRAELVEATGLNRTAVRNGLKAIQADYIANARLMVEKLQQKRCDVIICIAHVDDRNAKALPDSVAGIDIVMGGKVAGPMKKVHQVGESYYINSGDRGRFVGHMQLFLDRTRTIDSVAVSIESMETNDPEDPYVKALVDEFKVTYDAAKGKQPGKHQQPPVTKKAPASIQQSRVGSVEQLSPLRSGEAPPPKKKQVQPPIQKTPSTGAVEPRRN